MLYSTLWLGCFVGFAQLQGLEQAICPDYNAPNFFGLIQVYDNFDTPFALYLYTVQAKSLIYGSTQSNRTPVMYIPWGGLLFLPLTDPVITGQY